MDVFGPCHETETHPEIIAMANDFATRLCLEATGSYSIIKHKAQISLFAEMDKRKPIAVSLQLGFLSILLQEILKNIDTHERSENLSLQKQTPALIIPEKFPKKKRSPILLSLFLKGHQPLVRWWFSVSKLLSVCKGVPSP